MLISEAFEKYRKDRIVFGNQSIRTEESHNLALKSLLSYIPDQDIEILTFDQIRDWKISLDRRRLCDNTIRGMVLKIRLVLRHARLHGYDCVDPELLPVPKRADTVPSFISKEEVSRLIAHAFRLRSKAMISLLYGSGIRVSELLSLNRSDIKGDTFTLIGKGGKARLCFLDERTTNLLALYLKTRADNNPALFISQTGHRQTATNVQLTVRTAARNACIASRVTPHTLRHSFATNLLQSNCNPRNVQVMLGHKSLQTTQMYMHVVDYELAEVYRQFHTV